MLAMIGLFGLVAFGVLALWVKMDDKLIATVIAAVVLFTMARIGWSFFRACGRIGRRRTAPWPLCPLRTTGPW